MLESRREILYNYSLKRMKTLNMKKIKFDDLLNKLKTTKCLVKFRKDNEINCFKENEIYCSSLEKIRNAPLAKPDKSDGKIINKVKLCGNTIFENTDVFGLNKGKIIILLNENDSFYEIEHISLKNYIFCISCNDQNWTYEDLMKCIEYYGKYVFIIYDIRSFFLKIVKSKGKQLHPLALAPVDYKKDEKFLNCFQKKEEFKYEHELRLVFLEKGENGVKLKIDDLNEIGELFEVTEIKSQFNKK